MPTPSSTPLPPRNTSPDIPTPNDQIKLCSDCLQPLAPQAQSSSSDLAPNPSTAPSLDPFLPRLSSFSDLGFDGPNVPLVCASCLARRSEEGPGRTAPEDRTGEEAGNALGEGQSRTGDSREPVEASNLAAEQRQREGDGSDDRHQADPLPDEPTSTAATAAIDQPEGVLPTINNSSVHLISSSSAASSLQPSSAPPSASRPALSDPSSSASTLPTTTGTMSPNLPVSQSSGPAKSLPPASQSSTSSLSYLPRPTPRILTYSQPLSTRSPHVSYAARNVACLYPGSRFVGQQKSGRSQYDVTVTILDVNFIDATVYGYFEIRGLTAEHPILTTFFEGEIIGPKHGFLTRKWDATEQHDLAHWSRFPLFRPLKPTLRSTPNWSIPSPIVRIPPDLPLTSTSHLTAADSHLPSSNPSSSDPSTSSTIPSQTGCFMRWKEKFLVPNLSRSIAGATFDGFYYISVEFDPPSSLPPTTTVPNGSRASGGGASGGGSSLQDRSREAETSTTLRRFFPHYPSSSSQNESVSPAPSSTAPRRHIPNPFMPQPSPIPSPYIPPPSTSDRSLPVQEPSDASVAFPAPSLPPPRAPPSFEPSFDSLVNDRPALSLAQTSSDPFRASRNSTSPTRVLLAPPPTRPPPLTDSSSTRSATAAPPVSGPRSRAPGRLSGFYFSHQNAEPFQELNLRHVPEGLGGEGGTGMGVGQGRPMFEWA